MTQMSDLTSTKHRNKKEKTKARAVRRVTLARLEEK